MSRIHRRSLGIVSVLVAIVLAAPFLEGLYAKHVLTHLTQDPISSHTTITLSDYKVGWLGSTTKFHVEIRDPNPAATPTPPVTLDGLLELRHGPIVRLKNPDGSLRWVFAAAVLNQTITQANLTRLSANPLIANAIDNQLKNMRSTSVIELDGGVNSTILFPASHIKDANQQFDWDGAQISFSTNYNKTKSKTRVSLGKLALTTPDASANILPATLESDAHKGKYGLWLGHIRFILPNITLTNPKDASQTFHLNQLNFGWENQEEYNGDFVNTAFDVQLQSLQTKNGIHGPFHWAMAINHLDAAATAELDQLAKTYNPTQPDPQKQLPHLLLTMFSRNAVIDLKTLSLKSTSLGNLDMSGKVTLPSLPPDTHNMPGGPMYLFQGAQGELNLKADGLMMYALLQNSGILPPVAGAPATSPEETAPVPPAIPVDPHMQVPQNPTATPNPNELADKLLEAWIASGLLTRQDNIYSTKLTLKSGILTANGKAITPPQG